MKHPFLLASLVALVAGCSLTPPSGAAGDRLAPSVRARAIAPAYRVVRVIRRQGLERPAFLAALADRWLPALAAMHGPDGLSAYVSAVPPDGEPDLPDEVALAVYATEAGSERAWAGPAGRAAAALAADLFAPYHPAPAAPLAAVLVDGGAHDVLGSPTDWRTGFTTCFIGRRHAALTPADFLARLRGQVERERAAFGPHGLSGYVFMATRDHKLSFMHWPDMAAFGRAMASPEGRAVAAESQALMRTVQFASATGFSGTVAAGRAVVLAPAPKDP